MCVCVCVWSHLMKMVCSWSLMSNVQCLKDCVFLLCRFTRLSPSDTTNLLHWRRVKFHSQFPSPQTSLIVSACELLASFYSAEKWPDSNCFYFVLLFFFLGQKPLKLVASISDSQSEYWLWNCEYSCNSKGLKLSFFFVFFFSVFSTLSFWF